MTFNCDHKSDTCLCNARLPQDKLRRLAYALQRLDMHDCAHDIKLALFFADSIDKPRRDMPISRAILDTAEYLIEDMLSHIRDIEGGLNANDI